ncbi:cytidyltransferase [Streptomyces lavendulae]|uniref:cytidyltransferase n=1 Tax=Streptomyces lavendulae TaxID=1914 RepID=UPI0036C2A674
MGRPDLFHLNPLRHAAAHCDRLLVGVAIDEPARRRGDSPAVPLDERLAIVRAVGHVDEAVAAPTLDPMDAWQQVGFDRLFRGEHGQDTPSGRREARDFVRVGVEVILLPVLRRVGHRPPEDVRRPRRHATSAA